MSLLQHSTLPEVDRRMEAEYQAALDQSAARQAGCGCPTCARPFAGTAVK